jgi:hypothetical protein
MTWINQGFASILGMRAQSAYRTALVANNKVPFISEGIIGEYERILDESLEGNAGYSANDQGGKIIQGPLKVALRYDLKDGTNFVGTDLLIYMAMGTATWDTVNSSNQIKLAETLEVYATLAFLKGDIGTNALWEFVGGIARKMIISGKFGGNDSAIRADFDWLCYNDPRSSTVNSNTDLTGLPTVEPHRLIFGDMVFRIADIADALAAGDKKMITDFKLDLDNNCSAPEFGTAENTGHTDDSLIIQPNRNGFRTVKFSFTIPRYDVDTYFNAMVNGTHLQADLVFTFSSYKIAIYIPNMVVTKCEAPIPGPSIIPSTVECQCLRGNAYNYGVGNTYMKFLDNSTTIAQEIGIETKNGRTAVIS